jgi:hypothetical protein
MRCIREVKLPGFRGEVGDNPKMDFIGSIMVLISKQFMTNPGINACPVLSKNSSQSGEQTEAATQHGEERNFRPGWITEHPLTAGRGENPVITRRIFGEEAGFKATIKEKYSILLKDLEFVPEHIGVQGFL